MKVHEVIERLERDGWLLVRTRGSHRQFQHPNKPGTVTVAGGSSSRRSFMRYAVVVEKAEHNYSAYVPDLPGCVAAAETKEELLD